MEEDAQAEQDSPRTVREMMHSDPHGWYIFKPLGKKISQIGYLTQKEKVPKSFISSLINNIIMESSSVSEQQDNLLRTQPTVHVGRLMIEEDAPVEQLCSRIKLSNLAKALVMLAVILVIAVIIFVPVIVVKKHKLRIIASTSDDLCTTEGCATAAGFVLNHIDSTVDPCDNFFEFACGNWVKKNPIPDDKSRFSTFVKLSDDIDLQLKGLLEEHVADSAPQALHTLQDSYLACMNEDLIEQLSSSPLMDMLRELGGWPMVPSTEWNNASFDLIKLLVDLRLYNNRYIVNAYVSTDDKNSSANVLQVDQFQLGLSSRDYFLESTYFSRVAAYKKFMLDVATELGAEATQVNRDIEAVIAFEIAVANITVPNEERRDADARYNRMTVKELYTNSSAKVGDISAPFDWLRFFQHIFKPVNITITNQTELVNHEPEYFTELMDEVEKTPNHVLANYLVWRMVQSRVVHLNKAFRDLVSDFSKALYGSVITQSRWKACVSYAKSNMGEATSRLFVNKYFDVDAKSSAISMITGIRDAFDELLEEQEWMDEASRVAAREKSDSMYENIGYPEKLNDNTYLDEKYAELVGKLQRNTYFQNYVTSIVWASNDALDELNKPVDKQKWLTDPVVVNAYYSPTRNQIAFPAAILQPPFWQKDRPMSMNFGAIGSVIGHEITHGFDDQGRQFDKDGNLAHWWSQDVIDKFKQKTECIKDQYSGFLVPQVNMTLNGINTQGENIADNGGIKQSYRAYEEWTKTNTDMGRLPGLSKYSQKQLFFIAFGQIWCSSYRDASLINAIKIGAHSPAYYRVIGTISNFPEFGKEFNCPANARMNPSNRCSVW